MKLIPTSSQTVGPFFSIGLEYLADSSSVMRPGLEQVIEIRGKILDRDDSPVPDALLEFWSVGMLLDSRTPPTGSIVPEGFKRVATDDRGHFSTSIDRPKSIRMDDGQIHAPHVFVLIFARGLLRHLMTCVYFDGEPNNESDPVLMSIPAERRSRLIAKPVTGNLFEWEVKLQGADETVFFAW